VAERLAEAPTCLDDRHRLGVNSKRLCAELFVAETVNEAFVRAVLPRFAMVGERGPISLVSRRRHERVRYELGTVVEAEVVTFLAS